MGVLDVAADVAELVPAEDLAALETSALAEGFRCLTCNVPGVLGEEVVSVIAQRSEAIVSVGLAHRACKASVVEDLGPGALRVREEAEVVAVAVSWPSISGPRPVLIVDMPHSVAIENPGDRVDGVVEHLLRHGLHLVPSAGRTPGPASGWALRLTSPVAAVVDYPLGAAYDGTLIRPQGWEQLAARYGGAVLLVGSNLGMAAVGSHAHGIGRVNAAARAGLLVGGVIAVQ